MATVIVFLVELVKLFALGIAAIVLGTALFIAVLLFLQTVFTAGKRGK